MPKKNQTTQGAELTNFEPKKKQVNAIPLTKISTLRFKDEDGKLYRLEPHWGGEYRLFPTTE